MRRVKSITGVQDKEWYSTIKESAIIFVYKLSRYDGRVEKGSNLRNAISIVLFSTNGCDVTWEISWHLFIVMCLS